MLENVMLCYVKLSRGIHKKCSIGRRGIVWSCSNCSTPWRKRENRSPMVSQASDPHPGRFPLRFAPRLKGKEATESSNHALGQG